MLLKSLLNALIIVACALPFSIYGQADLAQNMQHTKVSLRMVGHQILLHSGDSISRVLPVTGANGKYKIEFSSDFEFEPDLLAKTIDSVVAETNLASHYIVEVVSCSNNDVLYSYEIGTASKDKIVPCAGRIQPKGCYQILFTILDKKTTAEPIDNSEINEKSTVKTVIFLAVMFLVSIFALWFLFRKKKSIQNPNWIQLGEFQFDKLNSFLLLKEQKIELTSKEADLLLLLYNDVNNTIEKEVLLNSVWGDEGDYVGRTLDVFISKLRKKLEFDPKLKIVNVRGVGYKLIVGE